jgi:hypothetical protein
MKHFALWMGWVLAGAFLAAGVALASEAPPATSGQSELISPSDEAPPSALKRRISLEASWGTVGMEQMPPSSSDTFMRATGTGMAFYLTSRYWIMESLAVRGRVGLLAPQIMVEANRANALRVGVPAQVSLQYDFGPLLNSYDIRPWIGAGPGMLLGSRDDGVFSTEGGIVTEAGLDFLLGKHFMVGATIGYQFVTGLQSAGLFTIGVGYVF